VRTGVSVLLRARYSSVWLVRSGGASVLFFFQAEDGIRDPLVTGVQTCALPISGGRLDAAPTGPADRPAPRVGRADRRPTRKEGRSEERRVGKEWRSRWRTRD